MWYSADLSSDSVFYTFESQFQYKAKSLITKARGGGGILVRKGFQNNLYGRFLLGYKGGCVLE